MINATGHDVTSRGGLLIAAALGLSLVALAPSGAEAAQAAKKKDSAAAAAQAREDAAKQSQNIQRAYAAGAKAFDAGDMIGAEQNLSAALAGGGLPNAQMARALYLRGAAYRRMGQPARAISDLTTAVWLKGGLTETDKKKATEERQLAYREAGLGETPPPIGAAPLDAPKTATPAAPPSASGAQIVQVTKQSIWSGISMPSISMPSISMPTFGGSPAPEQAAAAATPEQTAAADAPAQGSGQSSFWGFLPSLGGASQPPEAAPQGADPAFATTTTPAGQDGGGPAIGYAPAADATLVAQNPPGAKTSAWSTETAQSASEAAAVEAPQPQQVVASYVPPPTTGLSGGNNDAYSPAAAAAASAPAPATEPAAQQGTGWSNPLAGTGQAVTGFFSNMFASGAQTSAPADSGGALTTGSTEAAHGGWGPEQTVVTSQTSSMVQRGPDSPPTSGTEASAPTAWSTSAAPAPSAKKVASTGLSADKPGGAYKLQVAAVRSREEADRLAQSLKGYPAVRDGIVATEVDETVIGSMGTFYRVRLGPYANAKEPDQLCKTLRPQGFDCLVVTQ